MITRTLYEEQTARTAPPSVCVIRSGTFVFFTARTAAIFSFFVAGLRLTRSFLSRFHRQTRVSDEMYEPVTHVIFDMDGLLLDTEKVYLASITEVLRDHGKDYPRELRVRVMGTVPINTATIIVDELGLDVDPADLLAEFHEKQIVRMENVPLLPGAERLIDHLHANSVPIAVATSSGKDTFRVKTAQHREFFSKFHHIVLGSADPEVKRGKPAPDVFLVCASRFDGSPPPSKCLVFEDAPNGVAGARDAGMQTVMVPDAIIPVEQTARATQVISSLLDFKPEHFGLPPFP